MPTPTSFSVRLLAGTKEPVRLAGTVNISLSGLQTIDGFVCAVGDRVLAPAQTDPIENGIYIASEGDWLRAPDANRARLIKLGMQVAVQEGTVNAGKVFVFDTDEPDVDSDEIEIREAALAGALSLPEARASVNPGVVRFEDKDEDAGSGDDDQVAIAAALADTDFKEVVVTPGKTFKSSAIMSVRDGHKISGKGKITVTHTGHGFVLDTGVQALNLTFEDTYIQYDNVSANAGAAYRLLRSKDTYIHSSFVTGLDSFAHLGDSARADDALQTMILGCRYDQVVSTGSHAINVESASIIQAISNTWNGAAVAGTAVLDQNSDKNLDGLDYAFNTSENFPYVMRVRGAGGANFRVVGNLSDRNTATSYHINPSSGGTFQYGVWLGNIMSDDNGSADNVSRGFDFDESSSTIKCVVVMGNVIRTFGAEGVKSEADEIVIGPNIYSDLGEETTGTYYAINLVGGGDIHVAGGVVKGANHRGKVNIASGVGAFRVDVPAGDHGTTSKDVTLGDNLNGVDQIVVGPSGAQFDLGQIICVDCGYHASVSANDTVFMSPDGGTTQSTFFFYCDVAYRVLGIAITSDHNIAAGNIVCTPWQVDNAGTSAAITGAPTVTINSGNKHDTERSSTGGGLVAAGNRIGIRCAGDASVNGDRQLVGKLLIMRAKD
jgi:hypothetical protein